MVQRDSPAERAVDKADEVDADVDWDKLPLFQLVSQQFRRVPPGDAKDKFARAVAASWLLDTTGSQFPAPKNAQDIHDEFGFDLKAQKRYGISVGKEKAFESLLRPMNAPVTTYRYKQMDRKEYATRFNRDPCLLYTSQMVLTIAEWLHFAPHEYEIPLPRVIDQYLKGQGGD